MVCNVYFWLKTTALGKVYWTETTRRPSGELASWSCLYYVHAEKAGSSMRMAVGCSLFLLLLVNRYWFTTSLRVPWSDNCSFRARHWSHGGLLLTLSTSRRICGLWMISEKSEIRQDTKKTRRVERIRIRIRTHFSTNLQYTWESLLNHFITRFDCALEDLLASVVVMPVNVHLLIWLIVQHNSSTFSLLCFFDVSVGKRLAISVEVVVLIKTKSKTNQNEMTTRC